MSFGGSGFGFGQNNNTNTSSGFGFGSNNTTSGFGASNNTTAFGSNNTTNTPASGGLFGNSGGGFGSSSGFGSNNAFGAKPAGFGTATTSAGGGMFGSTTATAGSTGFGGSGFGSASTASPFGAGTGSSLFGGGNKPGGFGTTATNTTSGGLFGGSSTGTGFGGTNTTTGFGATNNPGLGTNIGEAPGTAQVAFNPTVEKEPNSSQSSSYQNIMFMDNYKKWSAEELRLADYSQGRRYGNTGGTGSFGGTSFGTGAFGSNNQPSTFGAANTTNAFGTSQPSAFGSTTATTGGGFGAGNSFGAKPGGLFGSTQPSTTGGGLFGQNSSTTTPFGGTGTTTGAFGAQAPSTGGGLFGSSTAAKPAGFGFGNTGTTTGSFGAPAAGTTTAFGGSSTTGGGLFGNNQATATPSAFGAAAAQQPAATGFGNTGFGNQTQNTAGGLFGNTQQKPGGLFGSSTTATGGGGLFGNTQTNTPGFGATAAQPAVAGGGLFGQKPAATGTGLFGQSAPTQPGATAVGGLFGGLSGSTQQQQPAQGGGLFGGLGQTQPKPSLFGSTQPATGGGLFGQSTQQAGGLFGSSQQQQPQANGLNSSLFNASQNTQATANSFSTSIIDPSAYGSHTLFSMPDNKAQDPGPLATPLSGTAKAKSRSILPMYKLSPANASRFATPQKRGFGFSYSTYGTPTSPSSVASTPGGLGQSLLMGSINRGLSKSISTSNLRRSLNVEDSILQPGAFSSSSGPRLLGSGGSQKKLIINRDMRSDLFAPTPKKDGQPQDATGPRKLTKRVSFDTHPNENGVQESPAMTPEVISSQAEDLGYLRPVTDSPNGVNGSKSAAAASEMEQVKGNELAIVHEEEHAAPVVIETVEPNGDKTPGAYWMSPSRDEIVGMNRVQRQKVADFTVGRENIGSVRFKVPVDLTNIDVDDLYDTIVILEPRSATVYPIAAKKPPVGKGLNVPAIISLEQSWPRGRDKKTSLKDRSGPRLQKHIERLKAIKNTTFMDYDVEKGIWTFSVEHFTTYGLDDDEEDETDVELTQTSHVMPQSTGQYDAASPDVASPQTDPDDTFDFKRNRRAVPGAFDEAALSDDEDAYVLPARRAPSVDREESESHYAAHVPDGDDTMEVEAAFQQAVIEASSPRSEVGEHGELAMSHALENDPQVPGGIMRARMRAVKKSMAPTRIEVAGGNDWTQILQESVRAPRTMDRAALRALNESGAAWDMKEHGSPVPQNRQVPDAAGFATSIDLMKSLFDQSRGPAQPLHSSSAKGFVKWPYQRRTKIDEHDGDVPASRPEWGPNGSLVTATDEGLTIIPAYGGRTTTISGDKLAQLQQYIEGTKVNINGGMPGGPSLRELAQHDTLWELATILFEDNGANLTTFWEQLVSDATVRSITSASTFEEKAIACLAGNRVLEASENLLAGGDFRLAALVSTIGTQTRDLRAQLNDWKTSNVLSEFSEPIRAIYELLGGNACSCTGVKGVSIENRVTSFVISQRFNLDWKQAFALRLFYTSGPANVAEAVKSFQVDIEQDREPEPDSPLWFLLKIFASGAFDWPSNNLDWLLTKAIYSSRILDFGLDAAERLDQASVAFSTSLTSNKHWVPAAFILLHLSDPAAREASLRDHLGRHAHLIGSPKTQGSPFALMVNFGVPETWLWEARALHFRSQQDSHLEFLALMWAKNFTEANRTFLDRLAPELVIRRDYKRLYTFAELLFKVKDRLPDWDTGAVAYLVYPMIRTQDKHHPLDRWDERLFDGLVALRAATHGDIRQEAAIADMAEDLLRCRGSDHRLLQLLPRDVKARHIRNSALVM